MAGLLCGAQDVPHVTLLHTGDTGKLFRDWPVPSGTRYTVKKITVKEAEEKLAKDEIRLAVTTVPLRKKGLKTVKFALMLQFWLLCLYVTGKIMFSFMKSL